MQRDFWYRQKSGEPLFPDLLWSRPQNRRLAGKLLIIGGNVHGFAAPAEAYNEAGRAGIGTARVLLPDSLQRTVRQLFAGSEYAPSTPSGSFSQQALSECLGLGSWADGTLLAGDLGRNSETAILLEQFVHKYQGQLTLTKDALDYFTAIPQHVLGRPETLLVMSFAQLQKLAMSAHATTAFTFHMDLLRLVDALHAFTLEYSIAVITKHLETIFVAYAGQVSTLRLSPDRSVWRVATAAHAATWWLQNPTKPFEALTIACTQR